MSALTGYPQPRGLRVGAQGVGGGAGVQAQVSHTGLRQLQTPTAIPGHPAGKRREYGKVRILKLCKYRKVIVSEVQNIGLLKHRKGIILEKLIYRKGGI